MRIKWCIAVLFIVLTTGSHAYARNCDQHCLEQLLSQIHTLREEIKSAIPVGTILPYSGSRGLPRGYVLCDGTALEKNLYPELFEIIGLTFTPNKEHTGTHFRVPSLGSKTLVGADADFKLGHTTGSKTYQLSIANLPPHQHSGTTDENDRGHTHSGITGNSNQDINHTHMLYGKDSGTGTNVPKGGDGHTPLHFNSETSGPLNKDLNIHTHSFTTGNANRTHQHPFTTNNGAIHGLWGREFSVMQPSMGMRFMIKAKNLGL